MSFRGREKRRILSRKEVRLGGGDGRGEGEGGGGGGTAETLHPKLFFVRQMSFRKKRRRNYGLEMSLNLKKINFK